jgi:hypothetical protein
LYCQGSKIKEIRQIYNDISEAIENEEIIMHELNLTSLEPGIGYTYSTIRMYYYFMQDDETGDVLDPPLTKVTANTSIAASLDIYMEYVFDAKEKLIFYYLKVEGYECGEERYYFNNQNVIKIKSNPLEECIDSDISHVFDTYEKDDNFTQEEKETTKRILSEAQNMKKLFKQLMRVEGQL